MRGPRQYFDWPLFVAVALICLLGLLNLYSATSAYPEELGQLYIQQLYWLAIGGGIAVLVAAIDYRHYERFAWVGYGACVVLLLLVFLLAPEVRGSQRWIYIGSLSLQPSELAKPILIIALAKHLHNDPKTEGRTLRDLILPALILAGPTSLILLQPDLGTALICAFIFASIMVLTNLKLRSLLTLIGGFALAAVPLYTLALQNYQRARFETWWAMITGKEIDIRGEAWQVYQSLVAIGSGGVWGKGFLQGTQNQHRFVPDTHSDFPFSVWAEEHGFFGVSLLLGLYLFLILWALRIASTAKDRFGAVTAVGAAAFLFWHSVINIVMVCGLLPVVGITLPFFSYGGSSLLSSMITIGLLMNVSMRRFTF
ncbi:MAG: rod shape-determining protein RodA [Sandaracinaceae bacterium]|nr:rod shape-determining protein RodA [Sandaracinaceae bacterium]MDW8245556.1 rod shape-determining protein RodA [Sandaracinaceae bacterium]